MHHAHLTRSTASRMWDIVSVKLPFTSAHKLCADVLTRPRRAQTLLGNVVSEAHLVPVGVASSGSECADISEAGGG
eukprot:1702606-Pyramimonas_sp.AAC.1